MFNCLKTRNRLITNLFEVYDCKDCLNYKHDYYFYLGIKTVYVYYLNKCENELFINPFEVKLLLIYFEILKSQDELYCIFLNHQEEIETYYDVIDDLISDGYNIVIIVD